MAPGSLLAFALLSEPPLHVGRAAPQRAAGRGRCAMPSPRRYCRLSPTGCVRSNVLPVHLKVPDCSGRLSKPVQCTHRDTGVLSQWASLHTWPLTGDSARLPVTAEPVGSSVKSQFKPPRFDWSVFFGLICRSSLHGPDTGPYSAIPATFPGCGLPVRGVLKFLLEVCCVYQYFLFYA